MTTRARRCLALACLLLAACSPVATPPLLPPALTLAPTATQPTATAQPAAPPTLTSPATEITDVTPTEPSMATRAPTPRNDGSRPLYDLSAVIDGQLHTLVVTASVSARAPVAGQLVFNFNALQTASALDLQRTIVDVPETDSLSVTPLVEGAWLTVPLPSSVAAGGLVTVTFNYAVALAPVEPWAWGWRGTLGWTPSQINLGDWYPVLAVYEAGAGWITHPPSELGEYQTTQASDFRVRLAVTGLAGPPPVLGSGQFEDCASTGGASCFSLQGGRFVAYVVGQRMQTQSFTTAAGQTVTSAFLPEHTVAGQAALRAAAAAMATFSEVYGAYDQPGYVQVEGDFYDGMEYSGLSFVGRSYYEAYDGTPQNLLTLISAHEAAHQWWHTRVGNDPASEPWLDEALATYSELIFLERRHPDAVAWWWASRVDEFQPEGEVNSTIYAHGDFRGYVDAVYLRGAKMLHTMRQAVGDERFFTFLRHYAADGAGRIATGAAFWRAYAAQGGDPAAIQAEYFAAP